MTPEQNAKKVGELIHAVNVAMLTTVCPDGSLRSRPMATQQAEFDGTLWFFCADDSPKAGEIRADRRVNVSYAEPKKQHYVSVSGTAELVRDAAKIKELWNPMYKAWFPKGLDDPQLVLMKVSAEKAEYWDVPSSSLVHLVGFVKAMVTGTEYRPGDNEKVDLPAGARS